MSHHTRGIGASVVYVYDHMSGKLQHCRGCKGCRDCTFDAVSLEKVKYPKPKFVLAQIRR